MAQYSWDNRIKFLVGYLYDLDNNGYMNKNDFDCLAVKFTVMEGRGQWNDKRFPLEHGSIFSGYENILLKNLLKILRWKYFEIHLLKIHYKF